MTHTPRDPAAHTSDSDAECLAERLVVDAATPLERAEQALGCVVTLARHADRLDRDPFAHVDGRWQALAADQRAYTEHAACCALVAIAADLRRIADALDRRPTNRPDRGDT